MNDIAEVGSTLQENIWNISMQNRMSPVVVRGEMKQVFSQIRIRGCDREAIRFHWIKTKDSEQVETLRFTEAIFGLGESTFLLSTTINTHIDVSKETYREFAENIEEIREKPIR